MHKPQFPESVNPQQSPQAHPADTRLSELLLAVAATIATATVTAKPVHAEDTPKINILGAGVDINNAAKKNDKCEKCPDTHRIAANISQHLATVDNRLVGRSKVPVTSIGFRYDGQVVNDGKLKIYLGPEIGVAIADGDSALTGGLNLALVTKPLRFHLGVEALYPPNAKNFQFGSLNGGITVFPTRSFGFGVELANGTNPLRELAIRSHQDAFCAEKNTKENADTCQTDLNDQTTLGGQIYIYPSDHFGLQFTGETTLDENEYWQVYGGLIFSF